MVRNGRKMSKDNSNTKWQENTAMIINYTRDGGKASTGNTAIIYCSTYAFPLVLFVAFVPSDALINPIEQ